MTDHLTKEKRSWNMSRIRSKNTKPELIVRKALHNSGIRYRLHNKDLPGKPDLSNKSKKFAIFVNGCFWHQHKGCDKNRMPKTRTDWWVEKINSNVKRDELNINKLKLMGFKVFVLWECELKDNNFFDGLNKEVVCKI
jgi:DNA mismatch endonuclease (patch repair protein)